MSGFVLIPREVYDSQIVGDSQENSHNSTSNTVQSLLSSNRIRHKAKILPYILERGQQTHSEGEDTEEQETKLENQNVVVNNLITQTEVEESNNDQLVPQLPLPTPKSTQTPPVTNVSKRQRKYQSILADVPILEGIKLTRTKQILDKFFRNPRVGLSASGRDTILVDGIDTNVNIGHFLYRIQTAKKLTRLEKDIKNIIDVRPQHRPPQWVKLDER
jgi:hypothetical protein